METSVLKDVSEVYHSYVKVQREESIMLESSVKVGNLERNFNSEIYDNP